VPRAFTLQLQEAGSATVRTLEGALEDQEVALLSEFSKEAHSLRECRWVQQGMPSGFELKFEGGILSTSSTLPPWDDVIVFIHRFRPFGLKDERTFVPKVCNVMSRRVPDDAIRLVLNRQKARFSGAHFQQYVRILANDVVLNSGETVDRWLNAFEYHRDLDKQALLAELHQMLPLDDAKALYLQLLADRALAVFNVAKIGDLILGTATQLQIGGTASTVFPETAG
jgi:hypothetical protein